MAAISMEGVPDIRVIVFRGVPVMSMTRLPPALARTREPAPGRGRRGIDIDTGLTNHAVLGGKPVPIHPDTNEAVIGRPIPQFARALEIAVRASDVRGSATSARRRRRRAPRSVILELNARPGLAIQVANRMGLVPRLQR